MAEKRRASLNEALGITALSDKPKPVDVGTISGGMVQVTDRISIGNKKIRIIVPGGGKVSASVSTSGTNIRKVRLSFTKRL